MDSFSTLSRLVMEPGSWGIMKKEHKLRGPSYNGNASKTVAHNGSRWNLLASDHKKKNIYINVQNAKRILGYKM